MLGVRTKIDVEKDQFVIPSSKRKCIPYHHLSKDLHRLLGELDDGHMNIYGWINFAYAKYIYIGKDTIQDDEKMIEIIIPQIDIHIKSTGDIIIKSNNKSEVTSIEKLIDSYQKGPIHNYEKSNGFEETIAYNEEKYKEMVSAAVQDIHQGRYDKVILSRKIPLPKRVNMFESYLSGRAYNTPARSYYIKLADREVIGFSPETIVEVDQDRNVYTFPLAGTRALDANKEVCERLKRELLTDSKEIAEHAISVQLAFEELERCCQKDSVAIINFMDVLERGTVY